MILASIYENIYLVVVTIITLVIYRQYRNRNGFNEFSPSKSDVISVGLILFLVFFIGLRPVNGGFGDTINYALWYKVLYEGTVFRFDSETSNLIFDNLFAWFGSVRLGISNFCLFISTIYFCASYLGLRKLFPNHRLTSFVVFLGAFSTFAYGVNGFKAGAATSLFIWALGYRDNLKICIPLILISWGFHHSMIMPVAAFAVTLFFKNPKYYFAGWLFCLLMAIAHITAFAHFFAGATTEQGTNYLINELSGYDTSKGGFRIDFVIYSIMPILIGYYAIIKKQLQMSDTYINLLNLYLCLNGTWMLCMYANFTNRIAYLSWFLYPIVLIYPFLNEQWGRNRYKTFSLVMLLHLSFTLFMNIRYV